LSFANNVSLGSAARTFTLGNNGVQTFSGIISNSSGGITFSANAGATGNFAITGTANTFTGPINITGGDVRFTSDGSIGNGANDIIIDGGRFGKGSDTTSVTLGAGRDIFVGDGVGTSINSASTGTLIYNNAIANKTGEIGSWAKQGSGTLSLGGVSTYSGDTAINQGILLLTTGNDRLPTGTVVSLGQAASANVSTLNLNGLNQQIAGLASTTGINSSANKNTVTSAAAATLDINVAEGTTKSYGAGTTQNSGVITGLLALTKSGLGTQVLGDANTYSGTTTVNAGTLAVNGSLLNTGSVVVNQNGFLGGSGKVGAISGAGTVGPGNSPGLLTATSVDPTAGMDFKFEFTALNPTYTSATASGNDLLHLTTASPFAGGTFASGNIISIYLNSSTITNSLLAGTNTTFSGGFFVDGTYGLAAALSPASFAYYTTSAALGTGSAVDYNGISYYLLDSTIAAKTTLSDTAVTGAGFATGTVSGTLLTFNAVPEPSAQSLLTFGMVALVAVRAVRRSRGNS
jgi:autotransporter-associated beta strand protein